LGITTGAAKTRVYRAAHRLRPKLELMEDDLR
jgi:DNA-directed RNA polymerase specialized sigma24 family protein